jgi:RNA ligase (TIGR02306 family)
MRKMASVRKIDAISPIPNADAIEVATIGGWQVVVKRDEFSVGDLAVYCEVDSWIPNAIAPFLSKDKEPREYNGVKGERLRTVKLRGTTSQGLLLKLEDCFDIVYVNGVACINITDSKTTRSVNDSIQDI